MNRASKKTLGMPVYSVREGQNLGTVKTLVIDPAEKSIIALVIERKRMTREERVVPFTHIQSIGDDVIIVDKAASAERKANLPHIIRQMRTPLYLLGARVFTVGGKTLGKVDEFHFDIKSGKISILEIGGQTGTFFKEKVNIDGKFIITMANGTIMLDDQALANLEVVENPLLNTLGTAKEKTSNLINETINASKRISKNISNSWEKLNNSDTEGYVSFEEEKAAAPTEETLQEAVGNAENPEITEENGASAVETNPEEPSLTQESPKEDAGTAESVDEPVKEEMLPDTKEDPWPSEDNTEEDSQENKG